MPMVRVGFWGGQGPLSGGRYFSEFTLNILMVFNILVVTNCTQFVLIAVVKYPAVSLNDEAVRQLLIAIVCMD
jgi:hypothetical protein